MNENTTTNTAIAEASDELFVDFSDLLETTDDDGGAVDVAEWKPMIPQRQTSRKRRNRERRQKPAIPPKPARRRKSQTRLSR